MKKIVLLCNAGMSTSMLVTKMKNVAASKHLDCQIEAYPLMQAEIKAVDADVILIGPQMAFAKEKVLDKLPGKPVEVINMRDYGTMNGENVLNMAFNILREK